MIVPVSQMLTPPRVAERLKVSPEKVITWIRSGELAAADVSLRPGTGRPRFRVDPQELDAFLRRRSVVPTPKTKRRRRRDPSVTEYF